jgi:hypothetical protein
MRLELEGPRISEAKQRLNSTGKEYGFNMGTIPERSFDAGEKLRKVFADIKEEARQENDSILQSGQNINPKGYEKFGIPEEEQRDQLLVNKYNGHFSKDMELNRKTIERTLRLAHLNGQIFLTSFVSSRNRSLDANSDGSVSRKKSLIFGEKIDKTEERENPYSRIVNVPEGWKIEINDQRIMEELLDKRIESKKQRQVFVNKFNYLTERGLEKCIIKEKLSSVKDEKFKRKLFDSLWCVGYPILLETVFPSKSFLGHVSFVVPISITNNVIFNELNELKNKSTLNGIKNFVEKIRENAPGFNLPDGIYKPSGRKCDHWWEYAMPQVEIDKVVESLVYLNIAGQNLVKKAK